MSHGNADVDVSYWRPFYISQGNYNEQLSVPVVIFYSYKHPYLTLKIESAFGSSNSPASDHWTLFIGYSRLDETDQIPITYLSSGEIDPIRTSQTNISRANALLEPAVAVLRKTAADRGLDFDFWEFMNWFFVGFYWGILADVGQISPVNYDPLPISPLPRLNTVNFTAATIYDSTNNCFVNETLFDKYSRYLTGKLLPLLGYPSPQIARLSDTNRLTPVATTFYRSYVCTIRDWKNALEATFAVFTNGYILVTAGMAAVLLIVSWLRNDDIGSSTLSAIHL